MTLHSMIGWVWWAGAAIIVPLGYWLAVREWLSPGRSFPGRWLPALWGLSVLTLGVSLLLPVGPLAAGLVLPHLLFCLALAGCAARLALQHAGRVWQDPHLLCTGFALGFLPIAGLHGIAYQAGLTWLNFDPLIIGLTAVHFHFAGYALLVIQATVWRHTPNSFNAWTARLLPLGIPLLAAGITFGGLFEFVCALLFSWLGLAVAIPLGKLATRQTKPTPMTAILVAAGSLATGMVFSQAYAVGVYFQQDWLTLPAMVVTHGLSNAVGFALVGLCGLLCLPNPRAAVHAVC